LWGYLATLAVSILNFGTRGHGYSKTFDIYYIV
jgi:hypothetical protein